MKKLPVHFHPEPPKEFPAGTCLSIVTVIYAVVDLEMLKA